MAFDRTTDETWVVAWDPATRSGRYVGIRGGERGDFLIHYYTDASGTIRPGYAPEWRNGQWGWQMALEHRFAWAGEVELVRWKEGLLYPLRGLDVTRLPAFDGADKHMLFVGRRGKEVGVWRGADELIASSQALANAETLQRFLAGEPIVVPWVSRNDQRLPRLVRLTHAETGDVVGYDVATVATGDAAVSDARALAVFQIGTKKGLKNQTGSVVVAATYDDIDQDDLNAPRRIVRVRVDDRLGLVDTTSGKEILPPRYGSIGPFDDASACTWFKEKDGERYAMVTRAGATFVIGHLLDSPRAYPAGYWVVVAGTPPRTGVVRLDGRGWQVPPDYDLVGHSDGIWSAKRGAGFARLGGDGRPATGFIFPGTLSAAGQDGLYIYSFRPGGTYRYLIGDGKDAAGPRSFGLVTASGKVLAAGYRAIGAFQDAGAKALAIAIDGHGRPGALDASGTWLAAAQAAELVLDAWQAAITAKDIRRALAAGEFISRHASKETGGQLSAWAYGIGYLGGDDQYAHGAKAHLVGQWKRGDRSEPTRRLLGPTLVKFLVDRLVECRQLDCLIQDWEWKDHQASLAILRQLDASTADVLESAVYRRTVAAAAPQRDYAREEAAERAAREYISGSAARMTQVYSDMDRGRREFVKDILAGKHEGWTVTSP